MLLFTSVQGVLALEIEISGNSSGNNEVSITSSSTTEVTQTNTATVTNDITVNANTGNNTASNNSGDVAIDTGNIETNVSVENSANTSIAEAGCCITNTNSAKISGNSGGNNSIQVNSGANTVVAVNQIATINNIVNGSANTGKNNASFNGGNVNISTGWIKQNDTIVNKNVNIAHTVVYAGDPAWNISISGNGSGSKNDILLNLSNNTITRVYNNADLNNISLWKLTTGDNTANKNEGSVTITTGNIYSSTAIKNDGINVSNVTVDCCKNDEPPIITPPVTPPPPPAGGCVNGCGGSSDNPKLSSGNGGGTGGSSSSSTGSVLGGAILPATGMSFWLFATIANILMFLLGLYLRMKAGRSPAKAYATR
jgi:hypothetical protein